MNRFFAAALAITCLIAGPARAGAYEDMAKPYITQLATKSVSGNVPRGLNPDPHFITIDPPEWYDAEQAAVSGYSWGTNPGRLAVGGAFRGYSDGSPWAFGIATEAIASPTSNAHLIGAEFLLASRNGSSQGAKWGINLILTNRIGDVIESPIGTNQFNERARALMIESAARSPAGEYSGWQTGIYFGKYAFDRSASKPYAAAMDFTEVVSQGAPWYVMVWQCGEVKCGIKISGVGLELWKNIEMLPQFVKML